MQLSGLNYLGKTSSGNGLSTFSAVNPASGQFMEPVFTEATTEEVSSAVELAESAFLAYKNKTSAEKADFLEAIADELLALGDVLVERAVAETALPQGRIVGERGRTMNQLKLFASVLREGSWLDARIDTAIPDRAPVPKPDIRQMQVALGPVGIFGASNFPLAFSVAGGDTASALAAGCPVVVKAHPLHPGTSELVGRAILAAAEKAGMPDGVFSLVQGSSVEVGMAIVTHPLIAAIGFTGSFRGGKALFDAANQRPVPIPVFAEMGSLNPVFVLPGALAERTPSIAEGLAGSLTLGVGQFCTNPGLLIVNKSQSSSTFLDALATSIGNSSPGTMLASSIKSSFSVGVAALQMATNVDLLASSATTTGANEAQANLFATNSGTFLENPKLHEEVFGPAMLCVATEDKSDMLRVASHLEGHLTATILGTDQDLTEYANLITILERKVGRIIFNGYPTGVEVCHSMVHGGPYPATTAPQSTSVGTAAIRRFTRPICFQGFPDAALPAALQDSNPLGIWRMTNGEIGKS